MGNCCTRGAEHQLAHQQQTEFTEGEVVEGPSAEYREATEK